MSTTRPMTDSPLAFTAEALAVARAALPAYSSKFSKKDFTLHQHAALLAVKQFLGLGYRALVAYLRDWSDLRQALGLKRVPHYTTLQKAHAAAGHPPAPAEPVVAAVDSTGYDARPVSHYFARLSGRRSRQRRWPKLTAVIDTRTHLFLSAAVTRGPREDAPQLIPVARAAVGRTPIDTLLADAGYDAEANHATCRERLGIRSTVIALNWRGSRKWPR